MNSTRVPSKLAVSTWLAILLLTSCGSKPEAMLASARNYLSKNDSKAAVIQIKNALQSNPNLPEARLLLGSVLLDDGDAVGAETELRKAVALQVPPDQTAPLLAQALLAQGQAKKLIDEFGKLELTQSTNQANLQTTLAAAYTTLGQGGASDVALSAALKMAPDYVPASVLLARKKAGQRDFDGAMAILDAVLAKAPESFEALKSKGDILLFSQGKPAEALLVYRKSVAIRPQFLAGHAAVIRVLLQQGNLDEAAQQIAQLKKFAANHPQTKYLEAQLAFQKKDFKAARNLIQQVLKVAPNNALGLQLAGAIEIELNSMLQAQAYLSKAVQLVPELYQSRRLLVVAYLRTGDTAKALAILGPGLNKGNADSELLAVAGEAYLQNGDVKLAEEYFSKAIKQDPQSSKKRTALAMAQMMDGQVDSAFDDLENIAASDKGTVADMALISAHLRRQEFDKALKAIERLEMKSPGKPVAAMLQGRTYLAKNDAIQARKSFDRAMTIEANYFPAIASLAALDIAEKKPEDAKKRFQAVLAKDPKNGPALLALADMAARSGSANEEVVKLIGNAVQANPAEVAPRMLLIDFHLRNKDFKLALSAAQDAVAAVPDSLELLDALGRSQQASGDLNQAVTTFTKLASMQPLSVQPYMRLASAHMAANNKEAAAQDLRKALEIKPDLQVAQRESIMLDVDGKNFQGALGTARTMQKQAPNEAAGYVLEGDIQAFQKNWNGALAAYRLGLAHISMPELALKYHATLLASGKSVDAEKFAATWHKEHSKDTAFVLYLADNAIAKQDYSLAERNYLEVLKLQPNNAVVYNNLAWVTAKLHKDGSVAYAEKANLLRPNQPAFMDTLAMLLSDKKEHAKAIELQKKVVVLQPDAPLFKLNLAKIQINAGDKVGALSTLNELSKLGDKFGGQAEVDTLRKQL